MMTDHQASLASVGVVVIGRNEGARLKRCLDSVVPIAAQVVYVDSGSTDNSVNIANDAGVEVVNLDLSIPFTAARARNEGFQRLHELIPDAAFVQFVDGDCEVVDGWLEQAVDYLANSPEVAVVCGRRRERFPQASVYNRLCDIEWNTPVGEARACGGDSLIRSDVFKQVSGFDPAVIAGEEPEMCVRIRQQGWKIWRLDAEMTLHDADMAHFSQWWQRSVRSGYAFALGKQMHGAAPENHWVREVRRARIWALYLPVVILLATWVKPVFAILFLIYPLQIIRLAMKNRQTISHHWLYAFYMTLGKFSEMQGEIKFYIDRLFKSQVGIIEYKNRG